MQIHASSRPATNESRSMSLVSACMGEAVLGFGDGIEVVNKVQDGGVFAEIKEEIAVAKGIRIDRDAPQKNGALELPSLKCLGEMDSDSLPKDAAVENGPTIYTQFVSLAHPAQLTNGKASRETVVLNGSTEEGKLKEKAGEDAIKCNGDEGDGGIVNGINHTGHPGSPDQLVEMVIQCLDEKVTLLF